MAPATLNVWAVFRFALSYPDERHVERFAELSADAPATLEEMRFLYIDLFEAGLPQPRCPLLESAWLLNRPAGEVVLENKLYYRNFGLDLDSRAAPDHLLTQLEFLAWLDHSIEAGNPDPESLERARVEFLQRHLSHWIGKAARLARKAQGRFYARLLEALAAEVASSLALAIPGGMTVKPDVRAGPQRIRHDEAAIVPAGEPGTETRDQPIPTLESY